MESWSVELSFAQISDRRGDRSLAQSRIELGRSLCASWITSTGDPTLLLEDKLSQSLPRDVLVSLRSVLRLRECGYLLVGERGPLRVRNVPHALRSGTVLSCVLS